MFGAAENGDHFQQGLKELMETNGSLDMIALALDCASPRVKIAIYEMFSTVCLVGKSTGHKYVVGRNNCLTLDRLASEAMSYFKYVKREPARFMHLVESLRFESIRSEHEMQTTEIWVT